MLDEKFPQKFSPFTSLSILMTELQNVVKKIASEAVKNIGLDKNEPQMGV